MCLPEGKTCDDCIHFERCCFLGATSKGQRECDWFPIRFKEAKQLKTWPEFFEAVLSGKKTFEIRKNDRDYRVNDLLLLQEYDPKTQEYTGREVLVQVTYMTNFGQPENQVVMSIVKV
jgi:hypothetical protein